MTNEEYQKQARERRYREEREASFRKNVEDYNRSQKQQREQEAAARKRAYSKNLGRMNAMPPIFGPGVDSKAYRQGKQEYDALQRSKKTMNAGYTPQYTSPRAGSGSTKRSGSGSALLFIFAIIAAVIYFGSSHKDGSSSTSQSASTDPVIVSYKPAASTPAVDQAPAPTTTQETAPQQFPPTSLDTREAPSAANSQIPVSTPAEANPVESAAERTGTENSDQVLVAAMVKNYEGYQTPWPLEGQRYVAEHKGIEGCRGELTLAVTGLQFNCMQNPGRSFSIPLKEIQEQDGDGIKLYTGKKFHFKLYSEKA